MSRVFGAEGIVGVVPPILLISLKFLSGDPLKWKYEAGSFAQAPFCRRSLSHERGREGEGER